MKKVFKTENNNYKFLKILILSWFIAFIIVGIAFSGFTSRLKVDGVALIQSHIYDYVYITNATVSGNSGASSINYSFLDHEIKASISAPNCNDYVTYKLDIVNTTPYKAYITSAGIASAVNGNGNPSSSFDVEFIDGDTNSPVIDNSTNIKPHSTKTIYVKMKNNCNGSDTSGIVIANFEYSLFKYYDLTIIADPNDSSIVLTTEDGVYTGTGSLTQRVMETEIVSYSVNREEYYTNNGTYTMPSHDAEVHVELEEITKKYMLTFDPNGGTVGTTSKIVAYGSEIGELPIPTKANAVFLGWFENRNALHDSSKNYVTNPIYYYADAYTDLYNDFQYNDNSLYHHYLDYGINEGRKITDYTASRIVDFDENKTLYAGWLYVWDKYDIGLAWDETLLLTDQKESVPTLKYSSWAVDRPQFETLPTLDMADGNTIDWTKLPGDQQKQQLGSSHAPFYIGGYYPATKDDIIIEYSSKKYKLEHTCCYALLKTKKVNITANITFDIYEVSNLRKARGKNNLGKVYSSYPNTYPTDGMQGDNWYVK